MSGCTRSGCSNVASSICTTTFSNIIEPDVFSVLLRRKATHFWMDHIEFLKIHSESNLIHVFFQHSRFFCVTTICISIWRKQIPPPNNPCIVYLPTFIIKIYQIWVNIPTHRLFGPPTTPTFFPSIFKRKRLRRNCTKPFTVVAFLMTSVSHFHSIRWQPSTAPGEDMGVS